MPPKKKKVEPLKVPLDTDINKEWGDEALRDFLRDFPGDFPGRYYSLRTVEVRVMLVGPDDQLTDVTDQVNLIDLQPDQIVGFKSDGYVPLPRGVNGKIDQKAVFELIHHILELQDKENKQTVESKAAMKEMENLLQESDRIIANLGR